MYNIILFVLSACVMFYMALRSRARRRRLLTKGQRVEARVVAEIQSHDGPAYALEFQTEGGSHRLHYPKVTKGNGFTVGQTVTLYYDPDDLEQLYVEGDRAVLGAEKLYWALGAVLLGLMVWLIVM